MSRLILFTFLNSFILVFSNIQAQSKISFIEANITYTSPQGHFGRNINNGYLGLEIGFLRQLKLQKPLFWGIDLYFNPLGSSTAFITEVVDFQLIDFDYSTTSNLLGLNGKMRFYPNINLGKSEIYAEAMFGYKWLFTNTTKTVSGDQDSSDSNFEKGSLSLTYGIAGGINYPYNDHLYINLRACYLPGLSVPYYALNKNNIAEFSSLDRFDLRRSTTDIMRLDIGITYRISAE